MTPETGPPGPLLPPPIWALLFAGAMVGAARLAPGLAFDVPGRPWIAGLLVAAGLGVDLSALLQFRRHRTTIDPTRPGRASALVTTGIYRLTRNPMYVGMAIVLTGIAVWTGSALALVLVPVFVWVLTAWQIRPEEAAMRTLFGEAFDAYAAAVPRWLIA